MADLLDTLSKKDAAVFSKDFIRLVQIALGMENNYLENNADVDVLMPRYKSLVNLFNKKYKGLLLKIQQTTTGLKIRVFFKNEKNVKDVFMNAARRITGIKSIGSESIGTDVSSPNFNEEIEKIKDKLQLSYYDPNLGATTVFLECDKKLKIVEICYSVEDVTNTKNPEFKLCAFYALVQGYDKKIDLSAKEAEFAFNDWSEDAKKKFLDKFDPLLYE